MSDSTCVCGHTAYWHSHGGTGDCEGGGQCECQKFDPESVSVEVATGVEALGGSGSDRSAATMEDEAREWAELFKDNDLGWAEHADDLDEAATFILALLAEIDRLRRVES